MLPRIYVGRSYEKIELHEGQAGVVLDGSHYPVLLTDWIGVPSEALVQRYFAAYIAMLEQIARTGGHAVLITTTEQAGRPPANVRKLIADLTSEHRELINRVVVGNAVVLNNPLIRGAMTAMSWLDPSLRVPYLANLREGMAYARETLGDHGVELPSADEMVAAL